MRLLIACYGHQEEDVTKLCFLIIVVVTSLLQLLTLIAARFVLSRVCFSYGTNDLLLY